MGIEIRQDIEISRLAANMAQMEANLMGKIAKLEADLVDGMERNRELKRKIAETKRKNDDLEAQFIEQNMEVREGKANIGELEGKIDALQIKISGLETQIQLERESKTAEMMKLQADLNRKMTWILNPDGWSYLAKTASWYKVIDQEMTFDQAVADCASRKGHLVSIHSQEENDFVWELAKTIHSDWGLWIGLKKNAFEWTDGNSVDFTNWTPGCPDSYTHAALGTGAGKWRAYLPTYQFRFICKKSSQF